MKLAGIIVTIAMFSYGLSAFAQGAEKYVEEMKQVFDDMKKAEEKLHDSAKLEGKPKPHLKKAEKHEKDAISGLEEIIRMLTEKCGKCGSKG
jgi:hypothetical protein